MAVVYCNRCGAENQATRGACLRCFNPLDWPPGGLTCGACGADNAQEARFCAECSEVLVDLPPLPECTREAAVTLILGAEDEIGPADEDFVGAVAEEEAAPEGVPEVDFGEEESAYEVAEVAPPPAEPEPAEEVEAAVPPPPPPGAEEIALGEEAEEAEEELFEAAGEFAPPPPPPGIDEIDIGEEEEGEEEEAPLFEPAAEEAPAFEAPTEGEEAEEAEEDTFAGLDFELEKLAEEEAAEEEPAAGEEPEEKPEKKEGDDELGGWVIDFGDDDEE